MDFVPCEGYTFRHEWTVTVNAPAGTLHEAFFDPVTDGTAVAADDSNGVLKPAAFTDANGASATLERIAWEPEVGESGTVKLQVNPPTGLTDQEVNFIALDGSVSLSLQVANATVDAANRTLSWAVGSQPWQSGDLLMLRIRRAGRTDAFESSVELIAGPTCSHALPEPHLELVAGRFLSRKSPRGDQRRQVGGAIGAGGVRRRDSSMGLGMTGGDLQGGSRGLGMTWGMCRDSRW